MYQGCSSLLDYNIIWYQNPHMHDIIHLQALNKLCRLEYEKKVSQDGLQRECEPEDTVHSSQGIFKTAMAVLALESLRVQAAGQVQQVYYRLIFFLDWGYLTARFLLVLLSLFTATVLLGLLLLGLIDDKSPRGAIDNKGVSHSTIDGWALKTWAIAVCH